MTLSPEIVRRIEEALAMVDFGEVVLLVHEGRLSGIDVKSRRRLPVDNCETHGVDSRK